MAQIINGKYIIELDELTSIELVDWLAFQPNTVPDQAYRISLTNFIKALPIIPAVAGQYDDIAELLLNQSGQTVDVFYKVADPSDDPDYNDLKDSEIKSVYYHLVDAKTGSLTDYNSIAIPKLESSKFPKLGNSLEVLTFDVKFRSAEWSSNKATLQAIANALKLSSPQDLLLDALSLKINTDNNPTDISRVLFGLDGQLIFEPINSSKIQSDSDSGDVTLDDDYALLLTITGNQNVTNGIANIGLTAKSFSTAAITEFQPSGNNRVRATSAAHGLSEGDYVEIVNTSNYNDIVEIKAVPNINEFDFTHSDDGDETGDWEKAENREIAVDLRVNAISVKEFTRQIEGEGRLNFSEQLSGLVNGEDITIYVKSNTAGEAIEILGTSQDSELKVIKISPINDYGRVFWVSNNVPIDNVGTIGDILNPFGPEALDSVVDTNGDTIIFMPGSYSLTNRIDVNIAGSYHYHFMNGVELTYNNTTYLLGNTTGEIYITGAGNFTCQDFRLFTNVKLFEFNEYTHNSTTEEIILDTENNQTIKGRKITLKSGANSVLNFSGITRIDYLIAEDSTQFFGIQNSTGNDHIIGQINSNGFGIRIDNAGATKQKINIGKITSLQKAIFSVNNTTGFDADININTINCSDSSGEAVSTLPKGTTIKINKIELTNGVNGIELQDGVTYDVNQIITSGGGFAIANTSDSFAAFNLKTNYIQQNGNQHAVYLKLLNSSIDTLFDRARLNIGICKAMVSTYSAILLQQTTTSTPTNEIEINGKYDAPENPIELILNSTVSNDLQLLLLNVTLNSGDSSNSIITNEVTQIKFRNTWSNAVLGANITTLLEGHHLNDEMQFATSAIFKGQVTANTDTIKTFSATPDFDFKNGNDWQTPVEGNITSWTTTNVKGSARYEIWFVNDGTPGRTVATPTGWTPIPGGDTHDTAANAVNLYQLITNPDATIKKYIIKNM